MVDQDNGENQNLGENNIIADDNETKEDLTTLFAVRTTINQESNILRQIFYRFKILDVVPDIRAMLVSPLLPGYVFFEAPTKRQVQIAVQGIPHIKGRIVQNIKLTELKHVLLPRSVTEYLEEGDTVEIISGVFEGSRAIVMRMPHDTSSSEEVVVRLLQEETPITIKIHGDYLKLVEKKKFEREEMPEITVAEGRVSADLEKAITFDEDYDELEEEYTETSKEDLSEDYDEEEEEFEDDDEWSKFDGF
ncbi:MAG: transcription elongation factor Spt5 [Candidatus Lokiarchaeota archaeon]|nr:transcription elongation factor Spt5 [Candidatus Lokiarchaeota archaeon]